MPCSQDNCPCQPTWRPVLELRSKRSGTVTRAMFCQLGYCDAHKQSSSLATFLSDEGFTKLSKFVREAGRENPDKSLTTLGWARLSEDEIGKLVKDQHHTLSGSDEGELAF